MGLYGEKLAKALSGVTPMWKIMKRVMCISGTMTVDWKGFKILI